MFKLVDTFKRQVR